MQTIPDDVPEPPRLSIPSSPPQLDAPSFATPTKRNDHVNGNGIRETPSATDLPSTNGIQTGREPMQLTDAPTVPKKAAEVPVLALENR